MRYSKPYISLFYFYIGFLSLFFIGRVLMIALHTTEWGSIPITELLPALYHGFSLDMSMISYAALLILVFLFLHIISPSPFLQKIFFYCIKIWIWIVGILFSTIIAAEITTYYEWKSKLNAKVLVHLAHPAEVLTTGSTQLNFIFILCILVLCLLVFFLVKIISKKNNFNNESYKISGSDFLINTFVWLGLSALCFITLRGGVSPIPIQLSRAYYSSERFCNDVAVNSPFAFFSSIAKQKNSLSSNPYKVMDEEKAQYYTSVLYGNQYMNKSYLFTTPNVNIVYIILESMRADVCSSFGSQSRATPFLDSISRQGLRFDHTYASGWTSDQGIVALLSATPQFEIATILSEPEKMRALPVLGDFINHKYFTSFYYGGDLDYGNIKAFLTEQKFKKIMDIDQFKQKYPSGKLGIHDGYMLGELITQLDQAPQPFFNAFFTQSTHSPYDFPRPVSYRTDQQPEEYYQGAFYTDSCLRTFFQIAKTKPWYDNTIFVFVSDHARMVENGSQVQDPENYRMIHFWYGEPLLEAYRHKHIETIVSQADILKTLLLQLDINTDAYHYSRDIFNLPPQLGSAPLTFHGMHGWYSPYCKWMYDMNGKKYIQNDADSTCTLYSTAFFQHTFKEFLQNK